MHTFLAGIGPLGTPEIIIILILIGALLAVPLAVVIGIVIWTRSQKRQSTSIPNPSPPQARAEAPPDIQGRSD